MPESTQCGRGSVVLGDALEVLPGLPTGQFQLIVADPPYFRVLRGERWDNAWSSAEGYLEWMEGWVAECRRLLRPDGLLYIFGQLGKREHVWLHVCSRLARVLQFHDMLIWDRVVGYNERRDSFTPQYEMILALRLPGDVRPYFDKDAVRLPYDEETMRRYQRDRRYKNQDARADHLRRGKFATNIVRVPSLKGSSREKVGHPSQKPLELIRMLIQSGSRVGDRILDPFLGSGTTAVAADSLGREWVGIEADPRYVEMALKRLRTDGSRPV